MSSHYLVVDDLRRVYFDCDKLLPLGTGSGDPCTLTEQPFEQWLRVVNMGEDPPEEARRLYDFLATSGWKARIVSLDSDDWDDVYEPWARDEGRDSYRCVGELAPELSEPDRHALTLALGPDTTWVVKHRVGERTVEDQAVIRVVDGLHARGYLELTREGPDGEDSRYRITDAGRRALGA